jgi:hypothetical protein
VEVESEDCSGVAEAVEPLAACEESAPRASPEPSAAAWAALSAAAARLKSIRGWTVRNRRAPIGTGSIPRCAAHEVIRVLVPSSEFSMLSAAF